MKQTVIIIAISLLISGAVQAATPTATPSSQINDLKERLATKVAELRQTQKKAIAGIVKETALSTFTVETPGSDMKIERTDEITVFQQIKGKRTTLTTDDIEKGDFVVVFGDLDTGLDLLNAKIVFIQSKPLERAAGVVTDIDRKAFTAEVKTPEGQQYTIDIEKTTNILQLTKDKGLVKGGFSKLVVGSTVHIVGTAVPKKERRISALRLVDLGNLTGATPTATATEEPTPTASTSVSASASATAKTTPKASSTPKPTPQPTATPIP